METKCADKVNDAWTERRKDLQTMLFPGPEDLIVELYEPENHEYSMVVAERDVANYNGGVLSVKIDLGEEPTDPEEWSEGFYRKIREDLFEDLQLEIEMTAGEAFNEFGLSFDYVAPATFNDQKEGYWRYQISFGGPSEEIRFYASSPHSDPYKIEFWYLDWGDGAAVDILDDVIAGVLWAAFVETETSDFAYREAME